jgi:intein/homing endonuclease
MPELIFSLLNFFVVILLILLTRYNRKIKNKSEDIFNKFSELEEKFNILNKITFESNLESIDLNKKATQVFKCLNEEWVKTAQFLSKSCSITENRVEKLCNSLIKEEITKKSSNRKKRTQESREISRNNMKRIWAERKLAKKPGRLGDKLTQILDTPIAIEVKNEREKFSLSR